MRKFVNKTIIIYKKLPCIMPDSKIKLIVDLIHYIALIFNILYIPLKLAFPDDVVNIN